MTAVTIRMLLKSMGTKLMATSMLPTSIPRQDRKNVSLMGQDRPACKCSVEIPSTRQRFCFLFFNSVYVTKESCSGLPIRCCCCCYLFISRIVFVPELVFRFLVEESFPNVFKSFPFVGLFSFTFAFCLFSS